MHAIHSLKHRHMECTHIYRHICMLMHTYTPIHAHTNADSYIHTKTHKHTNTHKTCISLVSSSVLAYAQHCMHHTQLTHISTHATAPHHHVLHIQTTKQSLACIQRHSMLCHIPTNCIESHSDTPHHLTYLSWPQLHITVSTDAKHAL